MPVGSHFSADRRKVAESAAGTAYTFKPTILLTISPVGWDSVPTRSEQSS